MTKDQERTYKKWKKLINMSHAELSWFVNSEWGKKAGLSRAEAKAKGIKSGRDSARAILRMMKKPVSKWNKSDWEWAKRQNSFNSRMLGQMKYWAKKKGSEAKVLWEEDGEPSRLLLSLLIWGHDPLK